MLLKCSDAITYDLCHAFDNCDDVEERAGGYQGDGEQSAEAQTGAQAEIEATDFKLILRKWYPLEEAMQFRCFVGEGELLAISQREVSRCYNLLQSMRSEVQDRMLPHLQPCNPNEYLANF